jgi:hypothetical protein
MEGQTDPQYTSLCHPAFYKPARFRKLDRKAASNSKSFWVVGSRLQTVINAVALPGWRNQNGAINSGLIHSHDKLAVRNRRGKMNDFAAAGDPRTFGSFFAPDVNLRVDNYHGKSILSYDPVT